MENNGYKYAELARGESLTAPETCDCCGRQGLKKTIKLVNPGGRVVWYGTGCAAKAMGSQQKLVEKKRKEAIKARDDEDRRIRNAMEKAKDIAWQNWLNDMTDVPNAWDGKPDRTRQIEALGGISNALALYREQCYG